MRSRIRILLLLWAIGATLVDMVGIWRGGER
jgi:hypothetical protein